MKGCFRFGRWILTFFISFLLFLIVTLVIPLFTVSRVITDPESVKDILVRTQVYQNFIPVALESFGAGSTGEGSVLNEMAAELNDPESKTRVELEKIVSRQLLQSSAETIIDAFYAWFRGETDLPKYEIALANDTESMSRILVFGLRYKVDSLPECPPEILEDPGANPFEMTCIPEGYSEDDVTSFIEENADRDEFNELKSKLVLSSDSLHIEPNVSDRVQLFYRILSNIPLCSGILYSILVLFIILISPERKKILALVGGITVVPALLWIIACTQTPQLVTFLTRQVESVATFDGKPLLVSLMHRSINEIVTLIANKITDTSLITGGIGVGIIIFSILLFIVLPKMTRTRKILVPKDNHIARQPADPAPAQTTE